jgi:hypothetical protein
MPIPMIKTPNALDEVVAASVQAQREKLMRRVRIQRILMRIVFGLSTCEALFALAAYLSGDYAAARFCALTSCVVFAFAYSAQISARKRALDALRATADPN